LREDQTLAEKVAELIAEIDSMSIEELEEMFAAVGFYPERRDEFKNKL